MDPWDVDDRAERAVVALEAIAEAMPGLVEAAQVFTARLGYVLVFLFGLFGWAVFNVLMDKRQRLLGDRL